MATVVVGIILLLAGRRLFWLFVAVMGFIVGAEVAAELFPQQSEMVMIGGVILGIIGAILAFLVQKVAIGVGGFLAGGYFLMTLLRSWELQPQGYSWIAFVVGGLVGALLMMSVFNWALIILSSCSGAYLIVHAFPMSQTVASAFTLALIVVGCLIQGRILGPKARDAAT
ncbi:MAG TPA: DUF4203 domain-containing protein [Roseimicrobium sp.]|nr:DUF4203 domain-containing protein [Roseimicrobium sp.]